LIQTQLEFGLKPAAIARSLNRPASKVSRKLRRNGWKRHTTANDGWERGFAAGGHDLGVNLALSLEQAKNRRFVARAPTALAALAAHPTRAKIRFIDFDLTRSQRRLTFTVLSDANTDLEENTVNCFAFQAR